MKSIPTCEQETTINYSRTDDTAFIWTSDVITMNKLDKLVEKDDSPWECIDIAKNPEYGILAKEYKCPKNMISFRSKKIVQSEEHRKKLAAHLRAYRGNRDSNSSEDS